jgi:hypothetical protein
MQEGETLQVGPLAIGLWKIQRMGMTAMQAGELVKGQSLLRFSGSDRGGECKGAGPFVEEAGSKTSSMFCSMLLVLDCIVFVESTGQSGLLGFTRVSHSCERGCSACCTGALSLQYQIVSRMCANLNLSQSSSLFCRRIATWQIYASQCLCSFSNKSGQQTRAMLLCNWKQFPAGGSLTGVGFLR